MAGPCSGGVFSILAVLVSASVCQAADLYWDANGAGNGVGGTSTWSQGSTWRNGSVDGGLQNWQTNANAFFTGSPGIVTVSNGSTATNVVAKTLTFTTTGYTLQPHATDPSNTSSITGNFSLDAGVNLAVMNAGTSLDRAMNLGGSFSGGTGASLTLNAGAAGKLNTINLNAANSVVAVPISLAGANAAYAAIVAGAAGVRIDGDISNSSASTLLLSAAASSDLTVTGAITGTAGVFFGSSPAGGSGAGVVVLSGQSTYTGKTTIANLASTGVVRLGVSDALPTGTALAFGVPASPNTSTGKLDLNNFNQTVASIETASNFITGTIVNDSAVAGTSVLTINGSASSVFNGKIRNGAVGKVAVVKAGTGTLSLRNDNAYTGTTTIRGGAIELGTKGEITASPIELAGGTLSIVANHEAGGVNSIAVASGASAVTSLGTQTGAFALGPITRAGGATVAITPPTSGTMTTTTANTAGTILGGWATAGTTTWAVSGSGTTAGAITPLTSFGSNYSNATTATDFDATAAGTFTGSGVNSLRFNTAAAATATLPAATFVVGSGGVLVTSTVAGNAVSITGGTITSGNGHDLIVHQHNTSATFSIDSIIADNGGTSIGLTKSGAGTLAIAGANTFSGATTVNAGRLLANTPAAQGSATGGGAVTVRNGGQLAGTGHVAGAVTVEAGGVISAGSGTGTTAAASDDIGTLSTGGQVWQAGGTFRVKYAGGTSAASAGTGYDTLTMPTLNLSGLAASGGVFKIVVLKTPGGTFNAAQDAQLRLATAGAITTADTGPAVGANVDLTRYFALDTTTLGISNSDTLTHFTIGTGSGGGDLMLFYDADGQSAPEPASVGLAVLASSVVLGRRRRRVR